MTLLTPALKVPVSECVVYHCKESAFQRVMAKHSTMAPSIAVCLFADDIAYLPQQQLLLVDSWLVSMIFFHCFMCLYDYLCVCLCVCVRAYAVSTSFPINIIYFIRLDFSLFFFC